jgi:hypothetical protein
MPMTELTQAEVYSPRSLQVWRTLLNWLAFFFQIFYQILRALGHRPMLSSASSSLLLLLSSPCRSLSSRTTTLRPPPPSKSPSPPPQTSTPTTGSRSSRYGLVTSLLFLEEVHFFFLSLIKFEFDPAFRVLFCYFSFTSSMFTSLVQLNDWI